MDPGFKSLRPYHFSSCTNRGFSMMTTPSVRSKISFDGKTIQVQHWLPNEKRSLIPWILFHDSLGCIELWRDFPALMANALGAEVYAYDRWGFGQSSVRSELPRPDFISQEAAEFQKIFLEHLGLKKVYLFGHSVGGAMALCCAERFPEAIAGVVTEATQARVETQTTEGIVTAYKSFKEPGQMKRLEKYHGDRAAWVLSAWHDVWLSPEFADWSIGREVRNLRCPVLALHGDHDEYGSARFPQLIADLTSHGQMKLIENCGHVPHREYPEMILNELVHFVVGK